MGFVVVVVGEGELIDDGTWIWTRSVVLSI
jgi:hypothetical protein